MYLALLKMTVTKDIIVKNIVENTQISKNDAANILSSFVFFVTKKSKSHTVKISNFGSFKYKTSPTRLGRNPRTKEEFIIPKISKCSFSPSNLLKGKIN